MHRYVSTISHHLSSLSAGLHGALLALFYNCLVYGWLNDSYSGMERYQSHVLKIGFRKGREATQLAAGHFLYDVVPIEFQGDNLSYHST